MFVENLKKQARDKISGNIDKNGKPKVMEEMEVVQTYSTLVGWNNVFLALAGVVLGAVAFVKKSPFSSLVAVPNSSFV